MSQTMMPIDNFFGGGTLANRPAVEISSGKCNAKLVIMI